jgi:hypothetical protein
MPYFEEQENKAGGDWGSLMGKLAIKAPATTPVDYRSFFHRHAAAAPAQMQTGGRIWPKMWELASKGLSKGKMAIEELGEEAAEQAATGSAKKHEQPSAEGENQLAYPMLASASEDPFERAALRAQAHYRDVPIRPYSATEDWLAENIIPKTPLDYASWAAFGPWSKALSVPVRAGILAAGGALNPTRTTTEPAAGTGQWTTPHMQYGGMIKAAAPLAPQMLKTVRYANAG